VPKICIKTRHSHTKNPKIFWGWGTAYPHVPPLQLDPGYATAVRDVLFTHRQSACVKMLAERCVALRYGSECDGGNQA